MKNYLLRFCFKILTLKIGKTASVLISITIIASSCESFFVENLSNSTIELLAPANNSNSGSISQRFSWTKNKHADRYRLQIFSVSSATNFSNILDTSIISNSFAYGLLPGSYFWFVMAENSYSLAYSDTFSITIDSSGSILNLTPVIITPNGEFYNNSVLTFTWNSSQEAEKYRFDLKIGNWNDERIDTSIIVPVKTITLNIPEGIYSWGVQGITDNIYTGFTIKKLTIDLTAPKIPELKTPEDNSVINSEETTFIWETDKDNGSPIHDSLFVSSDKNFNSIAYAENSINCTITLNFNKSGTYFWKVRRYDMAGNSSNYSNTRTIIIR